MSFFLRLSNTLSSSPLILSCQTQTLFNQLQNHPLPPSIKTLQNVRGHEASHLLGIVQGLVKDVFLVDQFVRSCFSSGFFTFSALSLFQQIQRPSLGLQNLVIRYLSNHSFYHDLLYVYLLSRPSGCRSDDFTFPFVIKACAALAAIRSGKEVHCVVITTGFEQNLVIQTASSDLYAKIGCLGLAHELIDEFVLTIKFRRDWLLSPPLSGHTHNLELEKLTCVT